MFIDFHSHFLPGIDDGAKTTSIGCEMAHESFKQGTEYLVATPHFYFDDSISIDEAIINRDNALDKIICYSQDNNIQIPKIIKGFEVAYDKSLLLMDSLDKFCIDNTNHILLELPYNNWSSTLTEEIYELSISGYNVILAHIERYLAIEGVRVLDLVDLDVKFQISCSVPIKGEDRKFLSYLIKNGRCCVMGTDMHNMDTRPCDISDSFKRFEKKYKNEVENLFYNNSHKILFS